MNCACVCPNANAASENQALSLFSSHRKNWFATRCEYLHLIKKNSQCLFARCEFFLMRCKFSQWTANQFLRWLEKRLKVPMQRKIGLCFYDRGWHFMMRWISWCCRFFNYGKGKYCNPRSNINILIPKMSRVRDRIRSLVTSHVRVMLGRSNISHCLCHCQSVIVFSFLIVYDLHWPRGEVDKICAILSFLH